MTTAAKRASKKANLAAKRARLAEGTSLGVQDEVAHFVTESEHAAAMIAAAATKRFAKKVKKNDA